MTNIDHTYCRVNMTTGDCASMHCVRCPERNMLHGGQWCPKCDAAQPEPDVPSAAQNDTVPAEQLCHDCLAVACRCLRD